MIVGEREALEKLGGAEKLPALLRAQADKSGGELRNPSLTPLLQESPSFGSGGYSLDALVVRIRFAAYETLALQVFESREIVGGRTCSAAASSPIVTGPAKTMTESADRRGAERPEALSSRRSLRRRWMAAE